MSGAAAANPAGGLAAEIDPGWFATCHATVRGVRLAYVSEGGGGVPLLCVHGWPETKRICWRVIEPLAAAGFEVIMPDLRGFGKSDVGDFGDTSACARDLHALCTEVPGHTSVFWAHPGAFDEAAVAFHTEPFGDAAKLRAGFRAYESSFPAATHARSEPGLLATNPAVRTLILFGASDRVIHPDFDRMAAVVFPDHVGPFLLRDCGHFVPWEAPHPLVSGTAAFCADLLAARR
jgi:pimeloyl-ACP methyl ester carboxylesterase